MGHDTSGKAGKGKGTAGKAPSSERPTEELREEALGVIGDVLKARMTWQVLRYAVQTAITCQHCGKVLDVRRAATLETNKAIAIACRPCFEAVCADIISRTGQEKWDSAIKAGVLEIVRGWDPEMLRIAEETFGEEV